jgi:hypothetical protein
MSSTYYERGVDSWESRESVVVRSRDSTIVASFPLSFIQRGGDNTWGYVLEVVDQLVNTDATHPWTIRDHEDQVVDRRQPPRAGIFWFDLLGMSVLSMSPRGRISRMTKF